MTKIAGADAVRHKQALDLLSFLYAQLKQHDFEYTSIDIPRTEAPEDKQSVCLITFKTSGEIIDVELSVSEDTFTFMMRAVALMRQSLKLYSTSGTVH